MLQRHNTFLNAIIFLVGVFVPVIGHILDTILILRDDHSKVGKALWLLIVWLFPFVGALLYMLFGHRPRPIAMINGPTYSQVPSAPIFPKQL